MKHSKVLERALKLQRRIEAKGLDVVVRVSRQVTKLSNYSYLVLHNIKTDKIKVNLEKFSDNEIIQLAEELSKPSYIKIEKICINSIDETVYIKENEEFKPRKIVAITRDGVLLEDNIICSKDDLYIKE